ncbi:MAG: acyl-CoA dehydrogenase family protein, partial [Planctomycetes bacterium]|nr:acyl-CoA dehydrogenase family protein [Planctomycetota bacterium]
MQLDPKYDDIQHTVREFCNKVLTKYAAYHDEEGTLHHDVLKGLKDGFLLGISVPEEYGGLGLDTVAFIIALEEISRVCPSTALTLAAHTSLSTMPIVNFGNQKQKEKFVPPLAAGDYLGSFCLTEPDSGSDIVSMKTIATKKGERYEVNGTKMYVTNGKYAGSYVLNTVSNPTGPKKDRLTTFVVKADLSGIQILKEEDKLGMRGSSTCLVSFENVEIPEENVLVGEGKGFEIVMNTLNNGRIGISAIANGIAIGAYNIARKYSKERKQFGIYLHEMQAIQFMLAEMRTQIEAGRNLAFQSARIKDAGGDFIKYASMAKLYSSQMAMDVTRKAIQILGGYGYMAEYG